MDGIPVDLPYRGEYAKTSRAGCKGCKEKIEKDELKLAFMVQSRFHDGKDAVWFHPICFFQKHRPKTVGDIAHFETFRWNDQEMVRKKIEAVASGAGVAGKGKEGKDALKDFSVAYAKSGASTCIACENKIEKAIVRVSKKDYESEKAVMWSQGAGVDRWHHLACFAKVRNELQFFESGKMLPGFKNLDKEDKAAVEAALPKIKPVAPPKAAEAAGSAKASASSSSGKRKLEEKSSAGPSKKSKKDGDDSSEMRKQNEQMFKYRDALKDEGYTKNELQSILSKNKQETPTGEAPCWERISDIMTFGALKPCPKCKGQFVFRSGVGYQCQGYLTEYTKCMNISLEPERTEFKFPNDFRERAPFKKYKGKIQKRLIQLVAPTASATATGGSSFAKLTTKPLKDFQFYISCPDDDQKATKWKNNITEFGGKISKSKSTKVAALITTPDAMEDKKNADIKWAEKKGIPVVKGDFAESITEVNYHLTEALNRNLICDWIKDVGPWLKKKNGEYEKPVEGKPERRGFEKKLTSVKMKMKDGAVVDPESELEDIGHVLRDGKNFYNCVLNRVSIEEQKNSYYKQQIIESDAGKHYWLFQSWGRIGTIIGGQKIHDHISKDEAIDLFCAKFRELSGNEWGRKYEKVPGAYTMLEIDYGEKEQLKKLVPSTEKSQLPMSVQELISMIFDVDRMKQAMMEFELNMEEMPLGKISRKQVLKAYSALSEASSMVEQLASGNEDKSISGQIRDATNRFYTLIPHNFGTKQPPMLDNEPLIKNKIDMLESLLEIELAYQMLQEGGAEGDSKIDTHYNTLDAAIDPLESGSEEFSMLQKYLKNTHAETHSNYTLDAEHIFKVNRKGENRRYRPFKELHNRKLLWHGSRVTNFAGILSQGLRIAPPEAPVTGYMFGKGVYFADMVSKSANYCCASPGNSSGLLLICEVALGEMKELKTANDKLTKAPANFHSVKGVGQTEPHPEKTVKLDDGVEIPLGEPVKTKAKNSDLLYNEYIVYDTAQVNIRYLMKVNFNFGSKKRR